MSAATTPAERAATSRVAGVALALAVFAADQASKAWVLALDLSQGPLKVLPVLDITLVWNRGISYGLLQQDGTGRWLLVAFTVVATLLLAAWLWRAQSGLVRLAVGGIIGGALGNLVDRTLYGAVVDFVHLHWRTFSWYVFNVADAAIVLGVVALLGDALLTRRAE
ncbi:signal peptidase II [Acuticoccus sp.]|uniref:signal peptidase II n=1 Tax=Acuticoccus sp. TaxID=1904378 RepID=UPI003B52D842